MAEALKDSGYAFIGAIPSSWKIARLNTVADLFGRIGWQGLTSDEYTDEGAWLVTGTDFDNGSIDWDSCVRVSEARWKEAYQIQLENGDLLITKDGTVGKLAIVDNLPGHASLNSGLMRIVPLGDDYNVKYLYYVLQTDIFREWFKDVNAGASTIKHLFQGDFKHFLFPLPSKEEQEEIVRILDSEVNKLDSIQDNLEKQISALERYKKSVIHEAVTKGLDPSVRLKDSKVDWISEIPEGWIIERLKFVGSFGKGLPIQKTDLVDEGVAVVSYGQIHSKMNRRAKMPESLWRYIPRKLAPVHSKSKLSKGDLVFADTSEDIEGVGNVCLITDEPEIYAGYHTIRLHPNADLADGHYLYYLAQSDAWRSQLRMLVMGVKVYSVTQSILSNTEVLLPPVMEQQQIATYLDERIEKLDKIIDIKRKQIEILKKHRQSLVYEYVTGKRRIEG